MALFKKKQKVMENFENPPQIPKAPNLPKLPNFNDNSFSKSIPNKLPSYPSNSLGNKFSQDTIKEAVSGQRGDYEEEDNSALIDENDMQMTPAPSRISSVRHTEEPVFIRIDKFEESLKIFEKVRGQVKEMEKMLSEIRQIKDSEEKELSSWGREIQNIKKQIENIDKDIFSKVE